jgi:hypothetical protein
MATKKLFSLHIGHLTLENLSSLTTEPADVASRSYFILSTSYFLRSIVQNRTPVGKASLLIEFPLPAPRQPPTFAASKQNSSIKYM